MRNIDLQADEPVFVPAILEAMFGDAHGVIATVLETFCTSMDQQMQLLQAARAAGDTLSQQQIAHRIKGAARMSGALALAQAAEQLEQVARSAPIGSSLQDCRGAVSESVLLRWLQLEGDALFLSARRGDSGNNLQGHG